MENKSSALENPSNSSKKSNFDMEISTQLKLWLLTLLGIWPVDDDANVFKKIFAKIRIPVCYFLLNFAYIPCLLHTIISETDPDIKVKMIGPLSFLMTAISKYSFMVTKRKEIFSCFEHIDDDWRQVKTINDHKIMLMDAQIGSRIVALCATFMYSGGLLFCTIIPFVGGSFVDSNNVTIRPLAYPVYDPLFSATATPAYELTFTIQCFSAFIICSVAIASHSLAAIFVLHACGQLKLVMSRLNNFVDGSSHVYPIPENKMAEIIQLHLRALKFIVQIEETLNTIFLIELTSCTFHICLLGHYIMTEFMRSDTFGAISYCVLLVSFVFNVFLLCYIGEMLTQQGGEVGSTAYMIDWYDLPRKNARGLILLLAISKNPHSITAGKIADLSYICFWWVLKTSMAYLNLLRKVAL